MRSMLAMFAATLVACASTSQGGYQTRSSDDLDREQVRMVQRALAEQGGDVEATGKWDSQTKLALVDFQRENALTPSGELDRATIEALGIDPTDVTPVRGTDSDDRRLQEIWTAP